MSENTPDLTILRNQVAYQNEYANCQGDVTGEFIGRYLEAEAKLKIVEKSQQALHQSLGAYKDRNDQLKQEVDQVKAELTAAKTNIEAFETQNNDMRNEIQDLRTKKQTLTQQRQEAQEEVGRLSEEILTLKQQLEDRGKGPKRGKRSQTQAK